MRLPVQREEVLLPQEAVRTRAHTVIGIRIKEIAVVGKATGRQLAREALLLGGANLLNPADVHIAGEERLQQTGLPERPVVLFALVVQIGKAQVIGSHAKGIEERMQESRTLRLPHFLRPHSVAARRHAEITFIGGSQVVIDGEIGMRRAGGILQAERHVHMYTGQWMRGAKFFTSK